MTNADRDVAELIDKQALHDNLMGYCRGIDRMDLELMKSTYWPDSTDDHGRFVGGGHEWCVEGMKSREALISCNHHISNVYSEIEGDRAKRESMFIVVTTYRDRDAVMVLGGRYRDLCEKRDGIWKILRRVCVWDWNQELAAKPGWHLMRAPEVTNWGQFHPFDPIYQDWWSSPPTQAQDSGRSVAPPVPRAG
jgi:hypothetical protein